MLRPQNHQPAAALQPQLRPGGWRTAGGGQKAAALLRCCCCCWLQARVVQHCLTAFAMASFSLPVQACYVWYNEMYKCYSQKGQEDEQCKKIKKDVR